VGGAALAKNLPQRSRANEFTDGRVVMFIFGLGRPLDNIVKIQVLRFEAPIMRIPQEFFLVRVEDYLVPQS